MVRFGAKKEEFIPPFLFYIILNYQFHSLYRKKKESRSPLNLFEYCFLNYAFSAYISLTFFQSTTLKNA